MSKFEFYGFKPLIWHSNFSYKFDGFTERKAAAPLLTSIIILWYNNLFIGTIIILWYDKPIHRFNS